MKEAACTRRKLEFNKILRRREKLCYRTSFENTFPHLDNEDAKS